MPDVDQISGKVSGQWLVKDTRILADGVNENADGGVSLEELTTDVYPNLGIERARRIILYARGSHPWAACVSLILLDENVPIALRRFLTGLDSGSVIYLG